MFWIDRRLRLSIPRNCVSEYLRDDSKQGLVAVLRPAGCALRWAKGIRGISISPLTPLESPYPLKRSGPDGPEPGAWIRGCQEERISGRARRLCCGVSVNKKRRRTSPPFDFSVVSFRHGRRAHRSLASCPPRAPPSCGWRHPCSTGDAASWAGSAHRAAASRAHPQSRSPPRGRRADA